MVIAPIYHRVRCEVYLPIGQCFSSYRKSCLSESQFYYCLFTLFLSALNPIDLGRIFIMLKMDVSALMGYTGALYKDFFGSGAGVFFTIGIMLVWIVVPLWWAVRAFKHKDL